MTDERLESAGRSSSGGAGGDPVAVLRAFLQTLSKEDSSSAATLITGASARMGPAPLPPAGASVGGDMGAPHLEGDEAIIPALLRMSRGDPGQVVLFALVPEDGTWKVDVPRTVRRTLDPELRPLMAWMDFQQALRDLRDRQVPRESASINGALGKPIEIAIDWPGLGESPEAPRLMGIKGLIPVRRALCLLATEPAARPRVAEGLHRVVLRRVRQPHEASCALAGGALDLALYLPTSPADHARTFDAGEIQQVIRDGLDLEVGPMLRRLREEVLPRFQGELRGRLGFDLKVNVEWSGFTRQATSAQALRALTNLEEDVLRGLGYAMREACGRVPAGDRLRALRLEHIPRPAEKVVFAQNATAVLRMHLLQDGGRFSGSDLEQILPGVLAGMAPADGAGEGRGAERGVADPVGSIEAYRERELPGVLARLQAAAGRPFPIEVDWSALVEVPRALEALRIWGPARLCGALGLLALTPAGRDALRDGVAGASLRFVRHPESARCAVTERTVCLALCPEEGERGCFYEYQIAEHLSDALGLETRPMLRRLQSECAGWEAELAALLRVPIVYAVDWTGFTSDSDTGRNCFALTLLREHGIDAIYYALSARCRRDPAFGDQVRRKVRTLRLTHVPRPADKEVSSDGNAIVYRLFLHEGYSGYLTIEEIEKRLPAVVAGMPDAPGRAGGRGRKGRP